MLRKIFLYALIETGDDGLDADDCINTAFKDWAADAQGGRALTRESFDRSWFQMADLNTGEEVNASSYASWIRSTTARLTKEASAEAGGRARVWQSDVEMVEELKGACHRAGTASSTVIAKRFKEWQAVMAKFFMREFGVDYMAWEKLLQAGRTLARHQFDKSRRPPRPPTPPTPEPVPRTPTPEPEPPTPEPEPALTWRELHTAAAFEPDIPPKPELPLPASPRPLSPTKPISPQPLRPPSTQLPLRPPSPPPTTPPRPPTPPPRPPKRPLPAPIIWKRPHDPGGGRHRTYQSKLAASASDSALLSKCSPPRKARPYLPPDGVGGTTRIYDSAAFGLVARMPNAHSTTIRVAMGPRARVRPASPDAMAGWTRLMTAQEATSQRERSASDEGPQLGTCTHSAWASPDQGRVSSCASRSRSGASLGGGFKLRAAAYGRCATGGATSPSLDTRASGCSTTEPTDSWHPVDHASSRGAAGGGGFGGDVGDGVGDGFGGSFNGRSPRHAALNASCCAALPSDSGMDELTSMMAHAVPCSQCGGGASGSFRHSPWMFDPLLGTEESSSPRGKDGGPLTQLPLRPSASLPALFIPGLSPQTVATAASTALLEHGSLTWLQSRREDLASVRSVLPHSSPLAGRLRAPSPPPRLGASGGTLTRKYVEQRLVQSMQPLRPPPPYYKEEEEEAALEKEEDDAHICASPLTALRRDNDVTPPRRPPVSTTRELRRLELAIITNVG